MLCGVVKGCADTPGQVSASPRPLIDGAGRVTALGSSLVGASSHRVRSSVVIRCNSEGLCGFVFVFASIVRWFVIVSRDVCLGGEFRVVCALLVCVCAA
jgi:hypothetical protein